MAAGAGAFALLSYRVADRERKNSQPGNLHVRTERSGKSKKKPENGISISLCAQWLSLDAIKL